MSINIYNENCLDTMARMDNNSVDLVITSPPYNMNLRIRNGSYCSRQITKELSTKYMGFDDNMPIDMFYDIHLAILKELLRVSKQVFYNIQIVTGSKRAFFKIIGELNEQLKEIIVWDKGVAQPAMGVGILNRQSELLLVFEQDNAISRQFKNATFERGTLNDVWTIKKERSKNKLHGATFPSALVEKIITNFSNVGDIIYDPFMGTGTTGRICKKLNRQFIGSELITHYFDFAKEAIENDN